MNYHRFPQNLGENQYVFINENLYVVNMVCQTLGGKRPLYYNHLVSCMSDIVHFIGRSTGGTTPQIICPKFGSGLAGGNWNFIAELIYDCWIREGIDVRVFYL
jgi:hypothetical protein